MAVPSDWSVIYHFLNGNQFATASDVRAICPHCRQATTFGNRSVEHDSPSSGRIRVYLLLQCNYTPCRKTIYVLTSIRTGSHQNEASDDFFMHPSRLIEPAHVSVPVIIAGDWREAQNAMQADAPKAAAVMLRRVLYSILIDKGCKLKPLKVGMKELIDGQRLPAIFDQWLPAIRDDGHDGAHPDRALSVSAENIGETFDYTAELLRFLYIEPYEFLQRKVRNAAPPVTATTKL